MRKQSLVAAKTKTDSSNTGRANVNQRKKRKKLGFEGKRKLGDHARAEEGESHRANPSTEFKGKEECETQREDAMYYHSLKPDGKTTKNEASAVKKRGANAMVLNFNPLGGPYLS